MFSFNQKKNYDFCELKFLFITLMLSSSKRMIFSFNQEKNILDQIEIYRKIVVWWIEKIGISV